ncbi:TolC family protein [Ramlibacter montanisoli]|uniref:TolC family protein n=1 Tax=Ramlibacter montanisoli TaxID=2732512 RepID=A0A849KPJ0_9BURK|nr:TolC family protein [Ramlibacter montanisoli]
MGALSHAQRGGIDPGGSGRNAAVLRLDQPLWTGGRITSVIDAASRRLDAAAAGVDEARLEMALRVLAAYLEALRQKGREEHATANAQEHERLLAMIQRRVTQEVSSQTDQRLAESRLQLARHDLSQARQSLRGALAQLSQLSDGSVGAVGWEGLEDPAGPPSLDAALAAALDASPTLRRLAHEEQAAEAAIAQRKSAVLPRVSLRVERVTGGGFPADSRALLVLQAQPGAGLSAHSGVQEAVARREAAHQARAAGERDLRERIALDWEEWIAARGRSEAARLSSTMSAEVFASYARQYVAGRKSWQEVLNAVREATQANFLLEDARAQAAGAAMRLRAQTGMLTTR